MMLLTWYRLCEWVVMPMGIINAPATFLQIINNLLMDMLDKRVVVFPEDILIYSYTMEEHFKLLNKVFTCLHKYAFYCKLKNCSFLQKTTNFFGFDITPEGMCISGVKVRSLKEWPKSTNI